MPNNIIMADASGYVANDWLALDKPSGDIESAIEFDATSYVVLAYHNGITGVSLPNTEYLPASFVDGCRALERFAAPNAKSSGTSVFRDTPLLGKLFLPLLPITTSMCQGSGIATGVFRGFNGDFVSNAFKSCPNLTALDIVGATGKFRGLESSPNLSVIIIRTNSVAALNGATDFNGTPFASGKSGGTLYVPSALIASYQSDANWSTLLGYPNNSILAIEGSIYETQYADGTPIPSA